MAETRATWWRRMPERRWQRVLLVIVLVAIVVRMVLPAIVRRVVVTQTDAALVGRLELDDVDLALLTGGFTLQGVRLFAGEAAPAGDPAAPASPAPEASAPSPQPSEAGAGPVGMAPVFSADRITVDLGYSAFLRRMVDVEQLELHGVAVSLDRAKDGTLVLPTAVPSEPVEETGPGWGVFVRSVILRDGRIGFRDYAVGDPPQEFEVTLPTLDAGELALLITESGLAPGKVALDAGIQDGTLHYEATIESLAAGPAYESHAVLTNIPIAGGRLYIPRVGWSDLTGRLDADVVHRFESQGAHMLRGTTALRELAVRVAGLDEPALAWKALAVDVAGIDFVTQHADVKTVTLAGAHVVTRPGGPEPLPVLRGLAAAAAAHVKESPSPEMTSPPTAAPTVIQPLATPTPEPSTVEPSPGSSPSAAPSPVVAHIDASTTKPWTWAIETVRVQDGLVRVVGGDGPIDVAVDADLAPLASAASTHTTVKIGLAPSSGGRVDVGGDLTVEPLGFAGTVAAKDLALAPLAQPVANATTRLVKRGVATLALDVAAGAAPQAPPDGVRVAGTIGLTDLDVAGDDPNVFAVRWQDLALAIAGVSAPGVLKPGAAPQPIEVALTSLTLTRPELVLTRGAEGLVLPASAAGGPASAASPAASSASPAPAASPMPAKSVAPPTAATTSTAASSAAAPVQARLGRIAIRRLRIAATDTAVQPYYRSTLDPIDLDAANVQWPETAAKDLKLVAKGLDGATFTLTGNVAPAGSKLVAKLTGLPLAPFNPYAASTGYGVGGGTAQLDSTIKFGPGRYDATSRLVFHGLDVRGGEGDTLFTSRFGMPLSLALSLMTDLRGDIVLDLPIAGDAKGMRTDVGTLVGNALARAILNAVTSPLKLIGAVANIGDKPASLAPPPLACLAGRATLADGEAAKLGQLAGLLGAAPGLQLHLRGEAGEDDRRWLREQALRAKLEKESGVVGQLRHIGERGARTAVLAVLTARAEGRDEPVPTEHQAWFETQVAAQAVPDEVLRELATARATVVQTELGKAHGVAKTRTVLDEPAAGGAARAVVSVGLGSAASAVAAKR